METLTLKNVVRASLTYSDTKIIPYFHSFHSTMDMYGKMFNFVHCTVLHFFFFFLSFFFHTYSQTLSQFHFSKFTIIDILLTKFLAAQICIVLYIKSLAKYRVTQFSLGNMKILARSTFGQHPLINNFCQTINAGAKHSR